MKTNVYSKSIIFFRAAAFSLCLATSLISLSGIASAAGRHEKTAHGGELQMIGECAIGHAEIIVEEGTVEIWILSGGRGVLKPVTLPDKTIGMKANIEGSKIPMTLILKAVPLDRSESVGNCSHFIGGLDELKGAGTRFRAAGKIIYNGAKLDLVINYPLDEGKPY
ncbi:MAG TPA: hypothetical protein PKK26_03200 [Candidatus Wallbacteria bacterium]|nr:hypothetical protein [Candidatus Wallbacteria bacterium]